MVLFLIKSCRFRYSQINESPRKLKVFLNLRGFLKSTASRARTCDLVHVKDALSQLSYDRVMREMGLEPTRPYSHKNLNLARLPIPTLPRM